MIETYAFSRRDCSADTPMVRQIKQSGFRSIPYLLVVGEKEEETRSISVRRQCEGDKGAMPVDEFAGMIRDEVNRQVNAL
jgi:threonyl-tRNA synthetase